MLILAVVLVIVLAISLIIAVRSSNQLQTEFDIMEIDLLEKTKALEKIRTENLILTKELDALKAEKQIASKNSKKSIEDLPKTEKVTKPRTRKKKTV